MSNLHPALMRDHSPCASCTSHEQHRSTISMVGEFRELGLREWGGSWTGGARHGQGGAHPRLPGVYPHLRRNTRFIESAVSSCRCAVVAPLEPRKHGSRKSSSYRITHAGPQTLGEGHRAQGHRAREAGREKGETGRGHCPTTPAAPGWLSECASACCVLPVFDHDFAWLGRARFRSRPGQPGPLLRRSSRARCFRSPQRFT